MHIAFIRDISYTPCDDHTARFIKFMDQTILGLSQSCWAKGFVGDTAKEAKDHARLYTIDTLKELWPIGDTTQLDLTRINVSMTVSDVRGDKSFFSAPYGCNGGSHPLHRPVSY